MEHVGSAIYTNLRKFNSMLFLEHASRNLPARPAIATRNGPA